jgi:glycerophosphoryl diester phosphodiesterase
LNDPKATLDKLYQDRVLVFAHRGASADAPPNTLPAFELAAQQGADGVELDVHRSVDGVPVVVHDFTVDATTDGHGVVSEMRLAQIKALDAGSWFDRQFANTRIPTLGEVFETVGNRMIVNVEIKSKSMQSDGVERAVATSIAHHGMQSRVIVSSFNPLTLRRFRQVMPEVAIGYLSANELPFFVPWLMTGVAHEARHPHHSMISAAYVERAKRRGQRVNAWTINDPDRAVELRELGVDGIITDQPETIRNALAG